MESLQALMPRLVAPVASGGAGLAVADVMVDGIFTAGVEPRFIVRIDLSCPYSTAYRWN